MPHTCTACTPDASSHLPGGAAVGISELEAVRDAVGHALGVAEGGVAGEALRRSCRAVAVGQRRVPGGRGCCHGAALDHGVLEWDVSHCCYLEAEGEILASRRKRSVADVPGKSCVVATTPGAGAEIRFMNAAENLGRVPK